MDKKSKKIKEAVAIKYSPFENSAPEVVASGKGVVADIILKAAEQNDIPVHSDPILVKTLTKLQIGQEIPPELYEVVAQILLFVAHIDEKLGINNEKYE